MTTFNSIIPEDLEVQQRHGQKNRGHMERFVRQIQQHKLTLFLVLLTACALITVWVDYEAMTYLLIHTVLTLASVVKWMIDVVSVVMGIPFQFIEDLLVVV